MSEAKKSKKGYPCGAVAMPAVATILKGANGVFTEVAKISNVITNSGLNYMFTNGTDMYDMSTVVFIGTGSLDTEIDSGTITASQSASAVSSSADIFSSEMVGHTIKWDTGEEAMITAYTSAQSVTVTPSQTVASDEFTIHCTGLTDLVSQTKYVTNLTQTVTYDSGTVHHRTEARFTGLAADTYTELAYGPTTSQKFGLLTIPAGIVLEAGEEILVYLDRETIIDTAVKTAELKDVASDDTETHIANISSQLACIAGGTTKRYWGTQMNSVGGFATLATSSSLSLPGVSFSTAWNPSGTGATLSKSRETYVTNSFERTVTWIFPTTTTGTFYGGYVWGCTGSSYPFTNYTQHAFVFDAAYTKDNQHNLKIPMTFSLQRVLVN